MFPRWGWGGGTLQAAGAAWRVEDGAELGRTGVTGLVMDVHLGAGRDSSRSIREPREWEAGDPLLLYPGGQARLSAVLGGIQGLEPGARRESKAVGPAEFLLS